MTAMLQPSGAAVTNTTANATTTTSRVCFHCGNAVPPQLQLYVDYHGQAQPMCCHGCQAVAQAILAGGFEQYYQQRSATAASAEAASTREEWQAYDEPSFLARHAQSLPNGDKELLLLLDGLRCAACVWLNEAAVRRLPGVVSFHINRMTERATLQFNPNVTPLSEVLRAIETIGYRAWPFDQQRAEHLEKNQHQQMLRRVFVAGIVMMQVMMFAAPWYFGAAGDIEPAWELLLRWASLLLTIPVMLYSAAPIFSGAWRDIKNRRIGMDVPVALALAAAFTASVWATLAQRGAVYFDSITMFVFLLLGARYFEMLARQRARQGLSRAMRAVPKQLMRISADDQQQVALNQIVAGDRVLIKAGETLALDVRLISAQAEIGLALLTGEAQPVIKQHGAELPAGAVNLGQAFEAQVLRLEADSFVSSLQRLIERAGRERPQLQLAADRVAAWFLSALLIFTALIGVVWWYIDPARALPIAIAVLVVSCPCALSLATPAALAGASAALARRGLLITRANVLEKMARLSDVAFDKTGTLTQARPVLQSVEVIAPGWTQQTALATAAALEQQTQHPYAQALLHAAAQQKLELPKLELNKLELSELELNEAGKLNLQIGAGVQGTINGTPYRLGKREFAQASLQTTSALPQAQVFLADETQILAAFSFDLPLRAGSQPALAYLQSHGLKVHLLSGDTQAATQALAETLNVNSARGDLTPQQKLEQIRAWQAQGKVVAMLGDGINDAPVLAGADVSIAMGDGTELAQISADAVLMTPQLEVVVSAVQIARKTLRVMKQNLAWATLYNLVAIPAAALGYVSPLVAAIGMSTSSLWVVLNALRLLK